LQPPRLYLFLLFISVEDANMHGLRVEYRHIRGSIIRDLTLQLIERSKHGKIVVVTDQSVSLLAAVRKRWLYTERKVWTTRAGTLKAGRIFELSEELSRLRSIRFSAKLADGFLSANITFATAEALLYAAPDCQTMIITCAIPKETQHMITSWMPRSGVVVIYG
jgi:hypothetical protein